MERWVLAVAMLCAAVGGTQGMLALRHGRRSRGTVLWMSAAFLAELGFLWLRGEKRGACPLADPGEILAFLGWSLTLFYLAIGPVYRLSLLGVFSAPVVVLCLGAALVPGMLDISPEQRLRVNGWGETHAAMSVLSYGALALAAVAGVMFLVLDRHLKEHDMKGALVMNMPPVRELLISLERLLWAGLAMLTIGVVAGFFMPGEGAAAHLVLATLVWAAYLALLVVKKTLGLTGRRFSWLAVVLFVGSLSVFAFV